MPKFRKKPIVIEAVEWTGEKDAADAILMLADDKEDEDASILFCDDGSLEIPTLEGEMRADPGDWIIKGVRGELYPCKPEIFEETYEAVDD